MKVNWGTSIVLAFAGFIVFILFFVVKTFTQKEYDYDLVSYKYYEDELAFQQTIDHSENTKSLVNHVLFEKEDHQLKIVIPNFKDELLAGEIIFYRPSNDQLDFIKQIKPKQTEYVFNDEILIGGRWNITVKWYYKSHPQKVYTIKEQLYY
ncbi:FixH family protein [Wenyingzhuangia sp. IMCC45467]